jgi:hypothetical protein
MRRKSRRSKRDNRLKSNLCGSLCVKFATCAFLLCTSLVFVSCRRDGANTNSAVTPRPPNVTTASAPLYDDAFRATLFLSNLPTTLEAGGQRVFQVKVRNTSPQTWPARGQIDGKFWVKLGGRWLKAEDGKIILDDARATLPHDIEPGAEVELSLIVTAPQKAGAYTLEIGMLQEQVAWFHQKGASPLRFVVQVK